MARPLNVSLDVAANEFSGPYAMNWRGGDAVVSLSTSGTCNLTVQGTNADLQRGETANWQAVSDDLTGVTASVQVGLYAVPRFIRVQRNSVAATPTVSLQITQAN